MPIRYTLALIIAALSGSLVYAQDAPKSEEPLILSAIAEDETTQQTEEESETLPDDVVQKSKPQAEDAQANDEQASKTSEEEEPLVLQLDEGFIGEEEMKELSKQPLFRNFTSAIGEVAPLPESVDLNGLDDQIRTWNGATPAQQTAPNVGIDPALESLLNQSLEIAECDLDSLPLMPSQRALLERIDAEIVRLWPLWIDAEMNRNVVGRRERDWRGADPTRFDVAPFRLIDAQGSDWSLAIDPPFYFKVVDLATGQEFFTQAGDFEKTAPDSPVMLLRAGRQFALEKDPAQVVPTGNSVRRKVLKNGVIQGTDASGRLVTDVNLGVIHLYSFLNPERLDSEDGVFFTPTPFSGEPQRVKLLPHSPTGVTQYKIALSNGKPEEILARVVTLCKSKRRLVEILTQPSVPLPQDEPFRDGSKDSGTKTPPEQPPFIAPKEAPIETPQETFELAPDGEENVELRLG